MNKILMITAKDVRATFTNRSLLLLMLATPVVLSTIIALAFSGVSGDDATIAAIPVALVNQDEGNSGAIYVELLTGEAQGGDADSANACPPVETDGDAGAGENALLTLTNTVVLSDPELARAGVDDGTYAAAIIVPADYSERVEYSPTNTTIDPVPVEVYGDSTRPISASIVNSIVEGFTNQTLTGNIAIASTVDTLIASGNPAIVGELDFCGFTSAFDGSLSTVLVEQRDLGGEAPAEVNLLVVFGAAQAAFFALFTASGSAATILEERDKGTLQRMIVSPTPRIYILLGKLLAVFTNVLLQMIFLFVAFTVIGSILDGEVTYIWGTNWPAIIALVVAVSLAAAGVGMFIAAAAKTPDQVNILGSVVALFMGAAGGAFFQFGEVPSVVDLLTRISIVRWGSEGFTKLAEGSTDILLNMVALLVIGAVLFFISLLIFNRRQDI